MRKILAVVLVVLFTSVSWALTARLATPDDIAFLKRDLLEGKIQVGKTRLKDIQGTYGDPVNITDSENSLTYDYGDLRIDFDKIKYFRKWEYDFSRKFAAKDEIDDLRFDLEDQQLVGDYVTYDNFVKDYDNPTEAYSTKDDGAMSVYYWGELRLTFENYIVVKSWRGKNLANEFSQTTETPTSTPAVATTATPEVK